MEALLLHYGYGMLFVASWLEGQVSTLICGFLIWTGHFNLWISFGVIVLADIFNDSLYYRMGRKLYKLPRVASFIDKSLFLSEHLATVKRFWFEHPLKTALLGKNAYIISVTIVAAAGVIKMPYGRFLSYTIPTSFVQPTIVLFIGYYLGNSYGLASKYIEYPGIIILIACLIVFFGARKLSKTVTQQIKQDIK